MKKYESYKESGIDWIGEMPSHWELTQLKHITDFINGAAFKPEDWIDDGIPIVRIQNLNGSNEFNYVSENLKVNNSCKLFGGELLFAWSGNIGTSFGPFLWKENSVAYLNQHIFKLDNYSYNKRYFYWLLKAVTAYIESKTHGIIGMVHITKKEIGGIEIPLLSNEEQSSISQYIDKKTSEIDQLIQQKETLLEKLQQKRQAIINEAVTKGRNSKAELKDSGLEWLGQIPKHWEVKKLKYVAELKSGDTITAEKIEPEGEYPVYGGNGLRGYTNDFTHEGQFVLIGRQGALCGNINYASGKFWASEHAVVVLTKTLINTIWLGELLRSMNLNQYSIASAQPGLSVERIKQLKVPFPSLEEQNEIANILKKRLTQFDKISEEIFQQIDKLKAYRQAIITEVVTGKRKVV